MTSLLALAPGPSSLRSMTARRFRAAGLSARLPADAVNEPSQARGDRLEGGGRDGDADHCAVGPFPTIGGEASAAGDDVVTTRLRKNISDDVIIVN
jgi:hypothetical protein